MTKKAIGISIGIACIVLIVLDFIRIQSFFHKVKNDDVSSVTLWKWYFAHYYWMGRYLTAKAFDHDAADIIHYMTKANEYASLYSDSIDLNRYSK